MSEVTDEMLSAGWRAYREHDGHKNGLRSAYLAMRAREPAASAVSGDAVEAALDAWPRGDGGHQFHWVRSPGGTEVPAWWVNGGWRLVGWDHVRSTEALAKCNWSYVGPCMRDAADRARGRSETDKRAMGLLRNCVDYWPSAQNDDLQHRTFIEARDFVSGQPEDPSAGDQGSTADAGRFSGKVALDVMLGTKMDAGRKAPEWTAPWQKLVTAMAISWLLEVEGDEGESDRRRAIINAAFAPAPEPAWPPGDCSYPDTCRRNGPQHGCQAFPERDCPHAGRAETEG